MVRSGGRVDFGRAHAEDYSVSIDTYSGFSLIWQSQASIWNMGDTVASLLFCPALVILKKSIKKLMGHK
jgi:hypothetical protein